MLKSLILKNWLSIVLIGLTAFLVMENMKVHGIVEDIKEGYEEDKEYQERRIDSLKTEATKNLTKIKKLDTAYYRTLSELEVIKNERNKITHTVPTYSDVKLDSIISNYSRPRQASERRDSIYSY